MAFLSSCCSKSILLNGSGSTCMEKAQLVRISLLISSNAAQLFFSLLLVLYAVMQTAHHIDYNILIYQYKGYLRAYACGTSSYIVVYSQEFLRAQGEAQFGVFETLDLILLCIRNLKCVISEGSG